jgi:hypothetical protein
MQALPIAIMVLCLAGVAAALVRALRGVRSIDLPDPTLTEDADMARLDDLVARKQAILRSIRSAELDLATEKIANEEYERIRSRLERDAVRVLRELERVRGTDSDLAHAEEAVRRSVAAIEDDTSEWSAAARLRHGGTLPHSAVQP